MLKRTNPYDDSPDVSPRTREILSDERRYGNGPPIWQVGKAQRPAQTSNEAHDERLKLATRLLRSGPETLALASRLTSCAPKSRCMSGACPECSRAFGRWFVSSAIACLTDLDGDIAVLSLVHADLAIPVGQLTPEHIHATRKTIKNILTKARITTFLGGTDISANEHHPALINHTDHGAEPDDAADHDPDEHDGDAHPHWQMQAWVFASANEVTCAERSLRTLFPRTAAIPRPVKIQSWDGDLGALGYAYKNTFVRRVRYLRPADPSTSKHACLNTRDRPLRTDHQAELLMTLDQVGLRSRLHLAGYRVVHTATGPKIQLINGR